MPKNLSFVKGGVDSHNLLSLNANREILQNSNIIKVISKRLLRKAVEMLRKLLEKEKSKKEKDNNIDNYTKEVQIKENGKVAETDTDELVADAKNNDPPPQDAMTTTTAATTTTWAARAVMTKMRWKILRGGSRGGAIRRTKTETTTKMTTTKRT